MSAHRPSRQEYAAARASLIAEMGGKCVPHAERGETVTDNLTFGHTNGRDWEPREKNRMQRLRLYRRDWLAGTCQLECFGCNTSAMLAGQRRTRRGTWRRRSRSKRPE